ncbi:hypothetical protein J6590_007120 [Homalodisca vitripennis]|nr:hypothetical protein J6590_007120 [Homalodisca vitripennis]
MRVMKLQKQVIRLIAHLNFRDCYSLIDVALRRFHCAAGLTACTAVSKTKQEGSNSDDEVEKAQQLHTKQQLLSKKPAIKQQCTTMDEVERAQLLRT